MDSRHNQEHFVDSTKYVDIKENIKSMSTDDLIKARDFLATKATKHVDMFSNVANAAYRSERIVNYVKQIESELKGRGVEDN